MGVLPMLRETASGIGVDPITGQLLRMSTAIIILAGGLALALYLFVDARRIDKSSAKAMAEWELLPTVEQYQEGTGGKGRGCQCSKCGSKSMRNRGLFSSNDTRRQFNCNHCGTVLYRNTVT